MIKNNTITGNSAYKFGGGLEFVYDCCPTVENNFIIDNSTDTNGGGGILLSHNCTGTISNNFIAGNSSNGSTCCGGGIHLRDNCTLNIPNNLIYNNSGTKGGGIDITNYSYATILNNTIHGNIASEEGAGIACREYSNATVVNTILWSNDAPVGPEIFIGSADNPSTLTIRFSDVDDGQSAVHVDPGSTFNWGSGMIDADPLFLDPWNDEYHLTCASPCIDAGDNFAPSLPATDFEGDPRIFPGNGKGVYLLGSTPLEAIVDMGADEYCLLKRQEYVQK